GERERERLASQPDLEDVGRRPARVGELGAAWSRATFPRRFAGLDDDEDVVLEIDDALKETLVLGAGCDGVSERLLRALHLAQDEPRSARERPGKGPVGLVEIATHIRRAAAGLVSLDGKEEASSVVVQSRSKARERAFVVA